MGDATAEKLTGAVLVEDMCRQERDIALRVEAILPELAERARGADVDGAFPRGNVDSLRRAGLLGLMVPEQYGGLGGGLRDLCAATFALSTVCPSTALTWYFHCSSASRGLLPLRAIDEGLYKEEEIPRVRDFAERVLLRMGEEQQWLGCFTSESGKSSRSALTILTEARRVDGGWRLNGVKSFGCGTHIADQYLVTSRLEGASDTDGLALFFVRRDSAGVRPRTRWSPMGMRGSSANGIIMEDVFVDEADALTIPGALSRMMQVSRGSYVGNQVASVCVYLGAAWSLYHHVVRHLRDSRFRDSGRPIGEAPFQLQLVGEMTRDLETAMLWARRQLWLETAEPPPFPREDVVKQWRLCKGEVAEAAHRLARGGLKASGTSGTQNDGAVVRFFRDITMGLVEAFPAERGLLEAAKIVITGKEQDWFGLH